MNITGLDFAFEFSTTTPDYRDSDNGDNDVLRVVSSVFGGITSNTDIELYLDIATLNDGDVFEGGFFTRSPLPSMQLDQANYSVFLADAAGEINFGGESWSVIDPAAWDIEVTSVFRRALFEGENSFTNSYATHFNFSQTPVPIPGAVWLFGSALLGLGWLKRRI